MNEWAIFAGKRVPEVSYGYFDLAVLKDSHNYLAVTASKSNMTLEKRGPELQGQVFVLDLDELTEPIKGKPGMVGVPDKAIRIVRFTSDEGPTNIGKGPQYITPVSVKRNDQDKPKEARFLLSNAFDYHWGVDTIVVPLDANGRFSGNAAVKSLKLKGQAGGQSINKYQMDIQRAQGAVYYYDKASDTEYALVADYYLGFNEPGWLNGDTAGKQTGGKVGIVKNPFGKNGIQPEYLGSTTPIINASLKDLALSPDGKTLMGNLNYWAQTGDTNPPKSGILSWNLQALIKAATDHSLTKQDAARPIPFDREGRYGQNTQIPAATPDKLDYGPVFGMTGNIVAPAIQAGSSNFGDIARVDIIKALEALFTNTCPLVTGFNKANIKIDLASQPYAKLVTYIDKYDEEQLVSGVQNSQLKAVSAAKDASYDGKFEQEGVFFLSAQFTEEEMDKLRKGERLPDRTIKIRVTGLTVGGESGKEYVFEINLKDYAETAGHSVFFGDRPVDDPGYTKFELSGAVSSTNVVDTAAEALDVWRVEQRLRYLGFPAMGTGSPTNQNNTLQDFKVDGKFAAEETAALRLFEKVVRYDTGLANRQFALASTGADGMIEAGATNAQAKLTTDWLNAYNAPHWMQLFASVANANGAAYAATNAALKGWENKQLGQNAPAGYKLSAVEVYGTSWMYDLMAAKSSTQISQFNGAVDANLGITPKTVTNGLHKTHDLGMAFDLGVGNNIGLAWQTKSTEPLTLDTAHLKNTPFDTSIPLDANNSLYGHIPNQADYEAGIWNIANANYLSGLLNSSRFPLDDQMAALRDFLSIYLLTRSDTTNGNGSWEELPMVNNDSNNTVRKALFGSGSDVGGLISQVHIGSLDANGAVISGQNPYYNINEILYSLGIVAKVPDYDEYSEVAGHQTHFHIYLNPPKPQEIITTAHLLAGPLPGSLADTATPVATPQAAAQGLLDYAQTITNTGEELMFIMDVPYAPVQGTPIVLAQAAAPGTGSGTQQPDYLLKECAEIPTSAQPTSAERGIDPAGLLTTFLGNRSNRYIDESTTATVKVALLESPTHGKLVANTSGSGRIYYMYFINDAESGYEGKDKAVFMAEFEGKTYKVVVDMTVAPVPGFPTNAGSLCPPPQLIKVNGKPVSGSSGYDLKSISVTFADLEGGAVGLTNASGITLDPTASGNNWYIDPTPADNSEYLPTSNPNEWVAKAGSAAAGKMDMLSVLLHEYGHALGIDHSADSHDYMGTTLTVGVRRLPSATEMALMQQLVAQAKGDVVGWVPTQQVGINSDLPGNAPSPIPFPLPLGGLGFAFAGLLRPNRYGSTSIDFASSVMPLHSTPQYDVAANAAFIGLADVVGWAPPTMPGEARPTLDGWLTQGGVNFVNGIATLSEISAAQTRLSQVFMLGANDRYLSFTLAGSALDNPSGAPQDAFEVALLDANTGLTVLSSDGLTRTDAFLNLQADGAQHAADCVTCTFNADGSRTYRVDLTNVAKNRAVNLSFDLLGFGASNSQITLRNIRVSGLPQLHDDVATLAEDNLLSFDPYAQADAALRPMSRHSIDNCVILTKGTR